jgi:hypothetical protein
MFANLSLGTYIGFIFRAKGFFGDFWQNFTDNDGSFGRDG